MQRTEHLEAAAAEHVFEVRYFYRNVGDVA